MSSFFSIHRPISVTTPIPNESSDKAFSTIFDSRPPIKHKPTEVIYTLAAAVDNLENAAGQQAQQMTAEELDLRQAVTQASSSHADQTTHLDLPAKTLHLNLQEIAKSFRPFTPPPAPVPLNIPATYERSTSNRGESSVPNEAQPTVSHRTYTTTLTIREATYSNGQKTYKTHTTPIIEVHSPSNTSDNRTIHLPPPPHNQPFLGRMRIRQLQYIDKLADRDGWMAISVKRQRKLKMKKHKYKKLMKRTKNLRRRLDRT